MKSEDWTKLFPNVYSGPRYIPYLDTYNGRTIRYPDLLIRPNNTIKVDLEENKIVEFIKFDVENVVTGSFETIHIQDSTGHEFTTRLGNVFTIGQSNLMRWAGLNGPSHWVESLNHRAELECRAHYAE
ncbi:hypothetical protein HID58_074603 [Brassica napus]|uniref:Uncharacterized protein n=1 Tax=Brassica napus TaxID=3708 RepID=A0ABQ7YKB1_BRANA|nr:hypothetical protein HID58_074603 [Brassica napus]